MDDLLDHLGPWHYPVLTLNALGGFSYTWRVLAMQFMAPKDLDYWCARPNRSVSLDEWRTINGGVDLHCYVREYDAVGGNFSVKRCDSWEFDHSNHQRTLTEEWQAVCGREWLLSYTQSLLMAGTLGSLVFSQISDWFGRRRAILLSFVLSTITGFVVAITSNFWTFTASRMLNFAVTMGVNTLGLESVGSKKRALVVMIGEIQWLSGLVTFPLVTYFVRDWRWIQMINTIPSIFWLVWTLCLDESPKWLISAGRYDDARKLVNKIVRKNRLGNVDVNRIIFDARHKIEAERKTQGRANMFDLFRGVSIAKITAACIMNDTTQAFLYYYLLYYTVDLGGNPYMSLIYTCLTEAPTQILAFFVLKYAHRKPVYTVTYLISILALVALLFLPHSSMTVELVLASIAKLSGQIGWTVLMVHTNEVFPTPVRAIGASFVHVISRIGAVTAPLMHPLNGTSNGWIPIVLTVVLCLLAWLSSYVLPETFGRNLPDTFHESKALLRDVKANMELKSRTPDSSETPGTRVSS